MSDKKIEAYKDGLNDKDYTWMNGIEDALDFPKRLAGWSDEQQEAFEQGKMDREKLDMQIELEKKK